MPTPPMSSRSVATRSVWWDPWISSIATPGRIRTLHFGEEAVVDALTTILGKMHQDAAAPEMIEVFCYSQHFRSLVRTRFQQLGG